MAYIGTAVRLKLLGPQQESIDALDLDLDRNRSLH